MANSHDLDSNSLGAVLKTALDAVVVMRLDGTIAGWNDVAEETFGWSYAEALGQRMSELIIPERYREAHERGLAHYLSTGEGPVLDQHFEIEALHRSGHELSVELSITRTEQFGEPIFLGFLRDIRDRKDAARQQQIMVGELNHRVKNLLAVVAGIAQQTARSTASLNEFSIAFEGRLVALGKAQEILTGSSVERAAFRSLIEGLLGAYLDGSEPQITLDGPDASLSPRYVMSLSMIFHELMTNAVKYGALSDPHGRVTVSWKLIHGKISLEWIERGLSNQQEPKHVGFGTTMIDLSVRHELRGHIEKEWREEGLFVRLAFPLSKTDV